VSVRAKKNRSCPVLSLLLSFSPLNTWDRQPYWTLSGVDDGFNDPAGRSFIRAWDTNEQNLMLNGYSK